MNDLIPKTEAQILAERINTRRVTMKNRIVNALNAIYADLNTPGLQQEILDVFGTQAVAGLTEYATFHAALEATTPGHFAPAPNTDIFQPQQDGKVSYIAPPEPEPEPFPEP